MVDGQSLPGSGENGVFVAFDIDLDQVGNYAEAVKSNRSDRQGPIIPQAPFTPIAGDNTEHGLAILIGSREGKYLDPLLERVQFHMPTQKREIFWQRLKGQHFRSFTGSE
jgi:hypothetical protein